MEYMKQNTLVVHTNDGTRVELPVMDYGDDTVNHVKIDNAARTVAREGVWTKDGLTFYPPQAIQKLTLE